MKKSLVSEVLIWFLASVITLLGIGGVSFAFGFKAISYETLISWGIFMISAFLMRNVMGIKGIWKGQTENIFIAWKNRVTSLYTTIRNEMQFKQKKAFCEDANKREKENLIVQTLQKHSIDDYYYDKILKESKKDKNIKTLKQLVNEEKDLNRKQKRVLNKILYNKLKLKPHSVNELNSTFEVKIKKIYDLKDRTKQAKRRDLRTWLFVASIIFLGTSSIIINGSQNLWLAITQGVITLGSLTWNGFNSYVKHIGYMTNEKVSYFQQKFAFGFDACNFNGIKYEDKVVEKVQENETEVQAVS